MSAISSRMNWVESEGMNSVWVASFSCVRVGTGLWYRLADSFGVRLEYVLTDLRLSGSIGFVSPEAA